MTDNDQDVLVVGAGPTGLTLAAVLARWGVRVRVVDAAAQPPHGSRAKGLQPRSLEVLDGLGLAARLTPELRVPATIGLYVVVVAVIVTAAAGWLRWFDRGPVELAWRSCFAAIDRAIPARSDPAIPPVRSPRVSR